MGCACLPAVSLMPRVHLSLTGYGPQRLFVTFRGTIRHPEVEYGSSGVSHPSKPPTIVEYECARVQPFNVEIAG